MYSVRLLNFRSFSFFPQLYYLLIIMENNLFTDYIYFQETPHRSSSLQVTKHPSLVSKFLKNNQKKKKEVSEACLTKHQGTRAASWLNGDRPLVSRPHY